MSQVSGCFKSRGRARSFAPKTKGLHMSISHRPRSCQSTGGTNAHAGDTGGVSAPKVLRDHQPMLQ